MKKCIFHKDIKYLFSTHILDIKNKLMKKIKIENMNKLIGNDISKLDFEMYGKKCQIIVYNAIFIYDSSKFSFITDLIGKVSNIIFWIKMSLFASTVIYD